MDIKNFDVSPNWEFFSSHDRILLNLEEFGNYKDKWEELRVNFGKKDVIDFPSSGGA